jgi:hypothetical protein
MEALILLHFPDELKHLRLDGHVQGSGGLVGNDEVR